VKAAAWLVVVVACAGDLDPPWQLDHDRIVAVRATPPHVPAGGTAQLDLLIGTKGATTAQRPPDVTRVVSPASLASAVSGMTVTAPSAATLDAVRGELMLASDAPVPLVVGVASGTLLATKTVWLGDTATNPDLVGVMVDGAPPGTAIVVGPDVDVPLSVEADDATQVVNWLTSCGTMHDFDLHRAYLHVLPADPQSGELAVVVRSPDGGVAWQVWPIAAE
jgi:hypothetical protein